MRVGLLGAGTVGSALLDLLAAHGPELTDRLGEPLAVAAVVVRDAAKPRRLSLPEGTLVTADAARVVDDPAISLVVEVIGGVDPALAYVERALRRGASVVTANKSLVAAHAPRLFAAARAGGGDLLFEACVGAAVPVVGAMQHALSAGRVRAVAGVLNGSTNFLLALLAEGVGFDEAVARARHLGYLEADPSDDVDGHDAARKIAILACLAGGRHVGPEAVTRRGLAGVGPGEVELAGALGATLKLLAVAERPPGASGPFSLWVAPALVPAHHPLAAVHGAANAVVVAVEPGGETLLAGQGAGGPPTAQAVAGDLIAAAVRRRAGLAGPLYAWRAGDAGGAGAAPMPAYAYAFLVACDGVDARRLERSAVGVAAVERVLPLGQGSFAVVTSMLDAAGADAVKQQIGHLPGVQAVGVPLVRWPGLGDGEGDWWRVPASRAAGLPVASPSRGGVRVG